MKFLLALLGAFLVLTGLSSPNGNADVSTTSPIAVQSASCDIVR